MQSAARVISPAVLAASVGPRRNFLSEVKVDFGPRDALNRLFLKADTELRELGIDLQFAPVEAMIEVNRCNRDSWIALFPTVNAAFGGFTADNGFCLLGRNRDGQIVTAHAVRLYTLNEGSFKSEAESLRLWYPDPAAMKGDGESCIVTCPSAGSLDGRAVFSGGVWFHPSVRKLGLTTIIGRVAKAYAFTRWYADLTFTMMLKPVLDLGTANRAGYPHIEWAVDVKKMPGLGDLRLALMWITAEEQIDYFNSFLATPYAKIDRVVAQRSANQR